jgi:hypothetical protein
MMKAGFWIFSLTPNPGEKVSKSSGDKTTIRNATLPITVCVFSGSIGEDTNYLFEFRRDEIPTKLPFVVFGADYQFSHWRTIGATTKPPTIKPTTRPISSV